MKKIILIILCACLFTGEIDASTYYGDYYPYIMGSETKVDETNTLKRKERKVYNTYQEIKVPTHFESDTRKCANYYADIYYDQIVSDSKDKINEYDLLYQSLPRRDKEMNNMFIGLDADIEVSEFYITDKGNIIEYTITDTNTEEIENIQYLNDGDLTTKTNFKKHSSFKINFDSISVNYAELHFISEDPFYASIQIYNDSVNVHTSIISTNHIDFITTNLEKELINKYGYLKGTRVLGSYYKNVKRSYLCYDLERIKTNLYQEENSQSIMDDFKILYDYYQRDIIVIDDIIHDENMDLKDLIKYSTIDYNNLKIESSIDENSINGEYEVIYNFDDKLIINHKVILDRIEVEEIEPPAEKTEPPIEEIEPPLVEECICLCEENDICDNNDNVDKEDTSNIEDEKNECPIVNETDNNLNVLEKIEEIKEEDNSLLADEIEDAIKEESNQEEKIVYLTKEECEETECEDKTTEKIVYKDSKNANYQFIFGIFTFLLLTLIIIVIRNLRRK